MTDWASRTTAYSYDDAGQPSTVAYPNTVTGTYTIDRAGRVSSLAYTRSGSALAAFGYTFNGQGQRLTETSPDGTTTYTYDNLGRLSGTTYPDTTPAETFGYDAAGNRTSRTSNGATTTYTYNDANELATAATSGSTATYSYDLDGNRTSVAVPPTADTTAPSVPAGPAATAQAPNQVTLSWTASTDDRGVTGYLVYRGGSLVGLVSGTTTTFLDRTTAPLVAYAYTVAAIDAAGNTSAQSSAANVTTPATGATVVAADRYGRTVSGGWGSADAGGAWTGTDSTFSVNGSAGLITLTGSATKNAYLASTSGSNAELLVRVRVDQIASGSATTDGFYLRRQRTSTWYGVASVFNTNSSIAVNFVRDSSGTTTTIGSATVSGVTHSTSTYDWLRARLSGTTATTAQIRLWADGPNEPSSWTLSSTDNSTPLSLRGSGSGGVYFAAGRALHAYYDDLTLRPIDSTAPTTPTGLSGSAVAAGRIDLSWTASTDTVGVAGYNLYRDGTRINTVPIGSTAYSDTGLTAGASHAYRVSAIDAAANESPQSNTYTGAAASGAVTTTYSYDAENRLTQLQTGSSVIGAYAYDGAGDRIGKTVGSATTAYTLDLASGLPQVLAETTGSSTSAYAYAGGPLEIDQAGTTYWYLSDTLGSVRLLTDSTGATPATYAYSEAPLSRAMLELPPLCPGFSDERAPKRACLPIVAPAKQRHDPARDFAVRFATHVGQHRSPVGQCSVFEEIVQRGERVSPAREMSVDHRAFPTSVQPSRRFATASASSTPKAWHCFSTAAQVLQGIAMPLYWLRRGLTSSRSKGRGWASCRMSCCRTAPLSSPCGYSRSSDASARAEASSPILSEIAATSRKSRVAFRSTMSHDLIRRISPGVGRRTRPSPVSTSRVSNGAARRWLRTVVMMPSSRPLITTGRSCRAVCQPAAASSCASTSSKREIRSGTT